MRLRIEFGLEASFCGLIWRKNDVSTKNYPEARIKYEPMGKRYSDSASPKEDTEGTDFTVSPGGMSDSDKWKLGGCPRCRGDVFLDSEDGELLGHCLQCGYVGDRVVTPVPSPNPDD